MATKSTAAGLAQLLRVKPVLSWGISAFVLGAAIAVSQVGQDINYIHGAIALVGVVIAQGFASHGFNDAVDWVTGTDKESIGKGTGGSRVIPEGKLTVLGTLVTGIAATAIVAAIGTYFIFIHGLPMVVLAAIAVAMPIIYSVPPFKLSYRPFNEVVAVLPSIAAIVVGADIVLSGSLSTLAIIAGVVHASFCVSWYIVSRLPDYAPDKKVGKITTIVYLGREKTPLVSAAYAGIGVFAAGVGVGLGFYEFLLTPFVAGWLAVGLCRLDVYDPTHASQIRLRNMHVTTIHAIGLAALFLASAGV